MSSEVKGRTPSGSGDNAPNTPNATQESGISGEHQKVTGEPQKGSGEYQKVSAEQKITSEHQQLGGTEPDVTSAVPMVPTPDRLKSLRTTLATHGASLGATEKRDIDRCLEMGAYSAAFEIAENAARKTPANLSLRRLADQLRSTSFYALEDRLGSLHRYVVWTGKQVSLAGDLADIVSLAKSRITIIDLVRIRRTQPLRTVELVLRLVHHGVLQLGAERKSYPPHRAAG